MALSVGCSLDYTSSDGGRVNIGSHSKSIAPAAIPAKTDIVSVGTSDETLAKGDVATIGYIWLKNLGPTNYVEFGSDGTLYPLKLKVNEFALLRWNAAALHAKANTAACNVQYAMLSD